MNKMGRRFTSLLFIAAMSTSVWAATKNVTLNVSGMTCPACPITIKKALNSSVLIPMAHKYRRKVSLKAFISFLET